MWRYVFDRVADVTLACVIGYALAQILFDQLSR